MENTISGETKLDLLFTGAGFTQNFGGYLGDDLVSETFSHPAVQASPTLRDRFLLDDRPNFEDIYAEVLGDPIQHPPLQQALLDVFDRLDAIVRSAGSNHNVSLSSLVPFFRHFVGTNEKRPGFIFTLNQDLFLERYFAREYSAVLPGLCGQAQGREIDHVHSLIPVQIDAQAGIDRVVATISAMNIIKLHGSSNWQTPDDKLFVAGRDKESIIRRWPLLAAYFEIFKAALCRKNVRLWVIGYGFLDSHVNKLIREAIDNHGLRLLIISPEDLPSLKKRMSEAQVRHGLAAHYRYRFRDLFPHGGLSVHAKAIERLLKDGK